MKQKQTDDASQFSPMAANFASRVGSCAGIVEPFKHLLRVTAHRQILVLELRAPMGACLGQYGIYGKIHVDGEAKRCNNNAYVHFCHLHFFADLYSLSLINLLNWNTTIHLTLCCYPLHYWVHMIRSNPGVGIIFVCNAYSYSWVIYEWRGRLSATNLSSET